MPYCEGCCLPYTAADKHSTVNVALLQLGNHAGCPATDGRLPCFISTSDKSSQQCRYVMAHSMDAWDFKWLVACTGQYPDDDRAVAMLWMACHDPLPLNTDAALLVWSVGSCVLAASCVQPLTKLLAQPAADVRLAAADALATTLQV